MAIDFEKHLKERLLRFSELADEISQRRGGRRIHPSTMYRWRSPGIRGVRLKCVRIGGVWYTDWSSFGTFCEQLTAAKDGVPAVDRNSTLAPAQDAAFESLKQLGW